MGFADSIRIMLGKLTPEEIAERDAAARQRRQATEQAALAAAAAEQATDEQYATVEQRFARCGGVASVPLKCHEDTWNFVHRWMNTDRGFLGAPWLVGGNRITRDGFMLTVRLSGPQLAEVIARIGWVAQAPGVRKPYRVPSPDAIDRAIGGRVYAAICEIIDQVDPDAPKDQQLPPIVLDDRAGTPEEPQGS